MTQPTVLDGIRVVDLSQGIAGGYCTKLLAGLGAEVIKVEPPVTGDSARNEPPFKDDKPGAENSMVHLHLGMAKKSVTLDVCSEPGRDILRRMLANADILIESYDTKTLADTGLDYDELAKDNPRLIYVSITDFGRTGPHADYKGGELVDYSAGGYTYLTGLPDREPIKSGGSQALYQGGLHAALGTMAALMQRDQNGTGDKLDVSIVEAICFTHCSMSPYLNDGAIYRRVGARLLSERPESLYPSTILPAKDGGFVHVHYSMSDPTLLGVVTGNPRLSDPDLWATPRGHADEMDELISNWLAEHDKYEAVQLAQELRNPFTEVLTPGDLITDPQFVERGFFVELDHPVHGTFKHLGAAFGMTGTPWQSGRAPLLGEHNAEVYASIGLTPDEIAGLQKRGII